MDVSVRTPLVPESKQESIVENYDSDGPKSVGNDVHSNHSKHGGSGNFRAPQPALPSLRSELRNLLVLGVPVALGIMSRAAMSLTDLALLGHLQTDALEAASVAWIWMYSTMIIIPLGMGSALSTLASQAVGAGNPVLARVWLRMSISWVVVFAAPIALLWWFTPQVAQHVFRVQPHVASRAGEFARWSILWILPMMVNVMMTRFLQAVKIVKCVLVINFLGVILNFCLNLMFIYGIPNGRHRDNHGRENFTYLIEGMGFKGSPIATSVTQWLQFVAISTFCFAYRRYHFEPERIMQARLKENRPSSDGRKGVARVSDDAKLDARLHHDGRGSAISKDTRSVTSNDGVSTDVRSKLLAGRDVSDDSEYNTFGGNGRGGVSSNVRVNGGGERVSDEDEVNPGDYIPDYQVIDIPNQDSSINQVTFDPPLPVAPTTNKTGIWSRWTDGLTRTRTKRFLISLSLPMMAGIALEEWQLDAISLMAAHLGKVDLSTHNAQMEIFFFLSSFMYGLMAAGLIRIGHYLGENRPRAAKRAGQTVFYTAIVLGACIGVTIVVTRDVIGHLYSNDPRIWHKSADVALLVGPVYVLLSVFFAATTVLDAQGRPGVVAVSFLIGAWVVAIPVAYLLAFPADQGLEGLWYGLCIGYAVVTMCAVPFVIWTDWGFWAEKAVQRAEKGDKQGDGDDETLSSGDSEGKQEGE